MARKPVRPAKPPKARTAGQSSSPAPARPLRAAALLAEEAVAELIAGHAKTVQDSAGRAQKVTRAAPNAASVIYNAVVIPGGASAAALAESGLAIHFVNEAYRHGKPIAALGDGVLLIMATAVGDAVSEDGVIVGDGASAIQDLVAALLRHRFPRREIAGVPV